MEQKIRIRDEHPGKFSESLETVFRVKKPKFFDADPDLGSENFFTGIRGKNSQL
jgi:hypothetical protein